MNRPDLHEFEIFFEKYCYKNLVSTVKSEDYDIQFYKMELGKQRATEADYRKFSKLVANKVVNYLENNDHPNTDSKKKKLIIKCLKSAWEQYNE